MAEEKIPLSDLPLRTPGAYDTVVGVDESSGESSRFPVPSAEGLKGYASLAALQAASGTPNQVARVTNDPNPANNGDYRWTGTGWAKSADRVSGIEGRLGGAEDEIETNSYAIEALNEIVTQPGSGRALFFIVNGQSNAVRRGPRATLSPPSNLYTFAGLNEAIDRTDGFAIAHPLQTSSFVSIQPYSEFGKDHEGMAPGVALVLGSEFETALTFTSGRGGFHYRNLMSGGFDNGGDADIYNAVRYGHRHLRALRPESIDYIMLWDQGEADGDTTAPGGSLTEGPITPTQYVDVVRDLVRETRKTLALATNTRGRPVTIMGITPVMSTGDGFRAVQDGHLLAARTVPGYYLAGPRYWSPYETDGVHVTGPGKRLLAEYFAHRLGDLRIGRSLPVFITSAARSGATITLTYNTIEGDIVLDTSDPRVSDTSTAYPNSRFGFECYVSGAVAPISTVAVSGKTVIITLASAPSGPVTVKYAQQSQPTGAQIVSGVNSKIPRGNVRDSGARSAIYDGSTLRNWACHQSIVTN